MQKRLENKLRMFKAVKQVLINFKAIWAAIQGFVTVVNDFEGNLNAIDANRVPAGTSTNGVTEDKSVMQSELIDSIMELSGPFVAMAARTRNNELKSKVAYVDSELEHLTEEALAKAGKELAVNARQYLKELASYGVTPEEVSELETQAVNYSAKIAGPREMVTERKASIEKQKQLFAETSLLLNEQLDGMVDRCRRTSPDFREAYFNARRIIDYGIRHEKKEENTNSEKA